MKHKADASQKVQFVDRLGIQFAIEMIAAQKCQFEGTLTGSKNSEGAGKLQHNSYLFWSIAGAQPRLS